MKHAPDLNLLLGLDALLRENSVTGAAGRLNLSVPAMSHMLARIRKEFDDPILVRTGREMVPTQRALDLKDRVRRLIDDALALQADEVRIDPTTLRRDFLIVAGEAVISFLGGPLVAYLRSHAPHVRCAFVAESPEFALRNYSVDLAIGPFSPPTRDIHLETLLLDRIVGVCRHDHPLLTSLVTEESYLRADHLINARGGRMVSPLDGLLGAERSVVVSAPTVSSLWILLDTDLVGLCYEQLERAAVRALGLSTFAIPYELELIPICQSWHAGHDTDPVHRWLRLVLHHVVGTIPRYEG
jgi:DNA-binding transcriptional LysR family regulator